MCVHNQCHSEFVPRRAVDSALRDCLRLLQSLNVSDEIRDKTMPEC